MAYAAYLNGAETSFLEFTALQRGRCAISYIHPNASTQGARTGENTAAYMYDTIGQVIADQASEVSGGTARVNEQLHYAFDAVGNLAYRTNNTLVANFQVNNLNELTANTNGGRLTVVGTTTATATNVTVNATNTAQRYGDATFAATNFPFLSSYTAVAADSLGRRSTNTVNVSLSTDNTAYVYDGNGNLLYDGTRTFAYDDENQLTQVLVSNQRLSQFSYDGKMRRRIRQEYTWQGSQWVQTNEVYYVYDGNEVIQERSANNLPATTYTRGKDLSGSLEGAGGIGGLLSMTLNTQPGPSSSNSYCYHSDGNGNVTMLVNASQSIVAKYLYDAFGNILSKSGVLADANLYRFSSKEAHLNSGLVYYLYRYYDPNLQRWPNRDPLGEPGFSILKSRISQDSELLLVSGVNFEGPNIYEFIANDPCNNLDSEGLQIIPFCLRLIAGKCKNGGNLGGKYNPPSCTLTSSCTTSAQIGPNATVCTYQCTAGGYSDEISGNPMQVTTTVAPGQPCPKTPPNAPLPPGVNVPPNQWYPK